MDSNNILGYQYEINQNIKPILILLEKAEQILSVINLPDSAIEKYNKIKEITFTKCNIKYYPLIKKNTQIINSFSNNSNNNASNTNNNSINNSINNSNNTTLQNKEPNNNLKNSNPSNYDEIKCLSMKKNALISILLDLIEKQKVENIKLYKNQLLKDANKLQKSLDNLFTFTTKSSGYIDNSFDIKIDDLKFNDYLSKCDMHIKSFVISLNNNNNSLQIDNSFENIIQNFNKKIEELKNFQKKEIMEYENKFNELKIKYNPNLEKDFNKLNNVLNQIEQMISPVYQRFSKKNVSCFNENLINNSNNNEDSKQIVQVNFLICFIEQLFKDNKHLIETVKNLEKDKEQLQNLLSFPYVNNTIKKNDILKNIYNLVISYDNNNNNLNAQNNNNDLNIQNLINNIQMSLKNK